MKTPTAHVMTYGCQMNAFDSEAIAERLVQMGFGFSAEWQQADLLVLNTCAIRDKSSERVFGVLGHVKTWKSEAPGRVVAVHGCMAAHEPEELRRRAPYVDILIDTNRVDDLMGAVGRAFPDLAASLGAAAEGGEVPVPFPDETPYKRFLPIMRGCNFFCTFCVVPYVRGRERYFSRDEIFARLEGFRRSGVREVTLLGQNVNSYRYEGIAFPDLLEAAALRFPELKFRFTTSNPWDFTPRLAEVMAGHENVAKHLHLPVQSGSDRVLSEMNRTYTADQYLAMVDVLRDLAPEVALTTDIIAGFPGEAEEDHEATLELMEAVRYDSAFMFFYSEREGTPAAELPGAVPLAVRKARLRQIIDLQIEHSKDRNVALLGRERLALVEGPARKTPGFLAGRMDDNKTVIFPAPAGGEPPLGRYLPVVITETDAFTLTGRARGEALPAPEAPPAEPAPSPAAWRV